MVTLGLLEETLLDKLKKLGWVRISTGSVTDVFSFELGIRYILIDKGSGRLFAYKDGYDATYIEVKELKLFDKYCKCVMKKEKYED